MLRVGLIVLPNFQAIGLSVLTTFELANRYARRSVYEVQVLSEHGGPVRSSFGSDLETARVGGTAFDTLLLAAGIDIPPLPAALATFLRAALPSTRRLGSICLAAFPLAESGLLDGRRATTHWAYIGDFRRRFPQVRVEADRLYINDGAIWTSAGMSAAIDLSLGMIEHDLGTAIARDVARAMVMDQRRSGGHTQRSAMLEIDARSDRIHTVLAYARRNLRRSLQVEDLAQVACLSPRQFTRLFRAETGTTPARALETLRLEEARRLLGQSRLPVEEIARAAGFGDRERMRRAFLRVHGEVPRSIRAAAGPVAAL